MSKQITTRLKVVEEVKDILCDCCGESCDTHAEFNKKQSHPTPFYEYVEINVHWGYGSKKDGDHHICILCEKCYDKMLIVMKITPTIEER